MRKSLFVYIFIIGLYSYAQNNTEISIQQDIRLLILGDNIGNNPLTINIISKIETSVLNHTKSFISVYLSFEYADLINKNYKRYAIGTGYILKSIYKRIGAGAYLDFGKIYRQEEGFYSFSLSGELNYKLNDRLKFLFLLQTTQRKDLMVLYNSEDRFKYSCFIGFKYRL